MKLMDITLPTRPGMLTYEGDPELRLEPVASVEAEGYEVKLLSMSTHTGTHVDAPAHFIPGGMSVDQLDLGHLCGHARVLDLRGAGQEIGRERLEAEGLEGTVRLLLRTDNCALLDASFDRSYTHLTVSGARYLRELGSVRLVGIDY